MAMNMKAKVLAGLFGSTILAGVALAGDAGDLSLVTAAKKGDRVAVQSLLNSSAKKEIAGPEGAAALVWAASRNDMEMVDLLLRAGADVKGANEFGATALYAAAAHPAALTAKLLAAGANPNAGLLSGETPLMEASRRGNLETVRALLSAKADPNAKEENYGHTALMAAVTQKHTAVVEELLRRGAEVDLGAISGFTPLMYAAQQTDADITRILIGAGAKPNLAQPQFGMTPLIIASAMVNAEVVDVLLDNGANPDAVDFRGYNPLLLVVRDGDIGMDLKTKDDVVRIVKALLAKGANPNFRLKQPTASRGTNTEIPLEGATPLLLAAETNNFDAVKALLEAGADPLVTTEAGTTAMVFASQAGASVQNMRTAEERALAIETVKLLWERGVDVNKSGTFGWTPLHGAAYQGLKEVIEFLVSKGANIDQKDEFGQTPLSISMAVLTKGIEHRRSQIPRRYRRDVVELILKLGATPLDKSGVEVVLQRTGDLELGREATNE